MQAQPAVVGHHHVANAIVVRLAIAVMVALGAWGLAAPEASARSTATGDLDADVVGVHSGRVLGTLHGSINGRHGFAVLIPSRRGVSSQRLWLHATPLARRRDGRVREWRVVGSEGRARVRIVQHADHRITGTGTTTDHQRFRIRGYGALARPNTGRGTLLVVDGRTSGRHHGERRRNPGRHRGKRRRGRAPAFTGSAPARDAEARSALRRNFRLRHVSLRRYRRARLLAHPALLAHAAGVLIGAGSSTQAARKAGLLRSFADAHRWVIVANATTRRLHSLRGILPVTRLPHSSSAPAVAMRLNGVKGLSDAKRAVIVYPGAPPAKVRLRRAGGRAMVPVDLTGRVSERLRRQRETVFARQLRRAGAPYARPTQPHPRKRPNASQTTGGTLNSQCTQAGQAPTSGSVDSCYQIDVIHDQQMVMPALGNVGIFCLWNGTLYCPGSSEFDALAGGPPADGSPYWASPAQFAAVCPQTGKNSNPFYYTAIVPTVEPYAINDSNPLPSNGLPGQLAPGFVASYNPCPGLNPPGGQQVAIYQETDSYFAVYDPTSQQQGVIVQVAGTITPNNSGDGGPAVESTNGGWNEPLSSSSMGLDETAWLLGGAQTQVKYTPPTNLGSAQPFQYAQPPVGNSYPTNQISDTTQSSTSTSASGFQVGVSGKSPSFQWNHSTSLSVETQVSVPDWTVIPNATTQSGGNSTVEYAWTSTTPISYQDMQCTNTSPSSAKGCGQPFGSSSYNTLNGSTWQPGSQTQWSGAQTGGYPVLTTTHNWDFVDHYSGFYGPWAAWADVFQDAQFSQDSSSTATTGFGSQEIDLCDPLVTSAGSLPPLCSG